MSDRHQEKKKAPSRAVSLLKLSSKDVYTRRDSSSTFNSSTQSPPCIQHSPSNSRLNLSVASDQISDTERTKSHSLESIILSDINAYKSEGAESIHVPLIVYDTVNWLVKQQLVDLYQLLTGDPDKQLLNRLTKKYAKAEGSLNSVPPSQSTAVWHLLRSYIYNLSDPIINFQPFADIALQRGFREALNHIHQESRSMIKQLAILLNKFKKIANAKEEQIILTQFCYLFFKIQIFFNSNLSSSSRSSSLLSFSNVKKDKRYVQSNLQSFEKTKREHMALTLVHYMYQEAQEIVKLVAEPQIPKLIPGETLNCRFYRVYLSDLGQVNLWLTNYRFIFKHHLVEEYSIPILSIQSIEYVGLVKKKSSKVISLSCKNHRTYYLEMESTSFSSMLLEAYQSFLCSNQITYLFAFQYKNKNVVNSLDSWDFYKPKDEFMRQRMIVSEHIYHEGLAWRLSAINAHYDLVPTYPALIPVVLSFKNHELKKFAQARLGQRFAVPIWASVPPSFNAVLLQADELDFSNLSESKDIKSLSKSPSDFKYISTIASYYKNCVMINPTEQKTAEFCYAGTPWIYHSMYLPSNDALAEQLTMAHFPNSRDNGTFSEGEGHQSPWLSTVHRLLTISSDIAGLLRMECCVLLVRSRQSDLAYVLGSLAQIFLDGYYRTIRGFGVLIEKDWSSYGFEFSSLSEYIGSTCHENGTKNQHSVFEVFIECLWQLLIQYPMHFEFSEHFLLSILQELYSCQFGTFLTSCARERDLIKDKTVNFWAFVQNALENGSKEYTNALFDIETLGSVINLPKDRSLNLKFWNARYSSSGALFESMRINYAVEAQIKRSIDAVRASKLKSNRKSNTYKSSSGYYKNESVSTKDRFELVHCSSSPYPCNQIQDNMKQEQKLETTKYLYLDLDGYNIADLPSCLTSPSNIYYIRSLRLTNNALTYIPIHTLHLTNLVKLDLSNNSLYEITSNFFQYMGKALPSLKILNVSNTKISRISNVNALHRLKVLILSRNLITKISSSISLLPHLEVLVMDSNKVRVIPKIMKRLKRLKVFFISNNLITTDTAYIRPTQFVTALNLGFNLMKAIPPRLFKMQALCFLCLNNNYLTKIPAEFSRLTLLEYLNFNNNLLSDIPSELGTLSRLSTLLLSHNRLTNFIEWHKSGSLVHLDLSSSKFTSIPPSVLLITSLIHLNMSRNEIFRIPTELPTSLVSLELLDLSYNRISTLDNLLSIRLMTNLKSLLIDHNSYSYIQPTIGFLCDTLTRIEFDEIEDALLSDNKESSVYRDQVMQGWRNQLACKEPVSRYTILVLGCQKSVGTTFLKSLFKNKKDGVVRTIYASDSYAPTNFADKYKWSFSASALYQKTNQVLTADIVINVWKINWNWTEAASLSFSIAETFSVYIIVWDSSQKDEAAINWAYLAKYKFYNLPVLLVEVGSDSSNTSVSKELFKNIYRQLPNFKGYFYFNTNVHRTIKVIQQQLEETLIEHIYEVKREIPYSYLLIERYIAADSAYMKSKLVSIEEFRQLASLCDVEDISDLIAYIKCADQCFYIDTKGFSNHILLDSTMLISFSDKIHLCDGIDRGLVQFSRAVDYSLVNWTPLETVYCIKAMMDLGSILYIPETSPATMCFTRDFGRGTAEDTRVIDPEGSNTMEILKNGENEEEQPSSTDEKTERLLKLESLVHFFENRQLHFYADFCKKFWNRNLFLPFFFKQSKPNLGEFWPKNDPSTEKTYHRFGRYYYFKSFPSSLFNRFLLRALSIVKPQLTWKAGFLVYDPSSGETVYVEHKFTKNLIFIKARTGELIRIANKFFQIIDALCYSMKLKHTIEIPCYHCIQERGKKTRFSLGCCVQALIHSQGSLYCRDMFLISADFLIPDLSFKFNLVRKIEYSDLIIGDLLGQGATAKVRLADLNGETVAVKEFRITSSETCSQGMMLGNSEDELVRAVSELRQEMHLMSIFCHPCITKMVGVILNPLCIVQEYCRAGNLFDYCHRDPEEKNTGYLCANYSLDVKDWPVRLKISLDVARGAELLHSFSPPIIHCDLKSPNILLVEQKDPEVPWIKQEVVAKLADFGLSGIVPVSVGRQVDNPVWLAPEVIKNENYNEKVDVYSFAVIMYELLTKKQFFHEMSFMVDIERAVTSGVRPSIPEDLKEIVEQVPEYVKLMEKCWNNDMDDRPSFSEISKYLEDMAENHFPNQIRIPPAAVKPDRYNIENGSIYLKLDTKPSFCQELSEVTMIERISLDEGVTVIWSDEDVVLVGHVLGKVTAFEVSYCDTENQPKKDRNRLSLDIKSLSSVYSANLSSAAENSEGNQKDKTTTASRSTRRHRSNTLENRGKKQEGKGQAHVHQHDEESKKKSLSSTVITIPTTANRESTSISSTDSGDLLKTHPMRPYSLNHLFTQKIAYNMIRFFRPYTEAITSICRFNSKIFTASKNNLTINCLYQSELPCHHLTELQEDRSNVVALLPFNNTLLVLMQSGVIRIYDQQFEKKKEYRSASMKPCAITYISSISQLWVGGAKKINRLDTSLKPLGSIAEFTSPVTVLVHVASHVWIGFADSTIMIWDIEANKHIDILRAHRDKVTSMIQIGNQVWSASNDRSIIIWDIKTRTVLAHLLDAHKEGVVSLCIIKRFEVWSGSSDGTICRWSIKCRSKSAHKNKHSSRT